MLLYLKDTPPLAHTPANNNTSRNTPIARETINHIYTALRNSDYIKERYDATELSLTVSTQLQMLEQLLINERNRLQKSTHSYSEQLREIADSLEY